ncbi:conserved hypothetical protein [Tenacibaculum maritimum]|uniref:DUF6939 family protein n=1 Tax=Tenacibaculum maritimum TaxID=107401 RepID=UPI0012E50391|nr:hypothetical protein [Tenacibaculum maritimum]CAA0250164.1 conserved hypothetical protein [Tenacibaculum maritimum]
MNKIIIESRRKKLKTLKNKYKGYPIIDVTSKAENPWVKFSPFYPHGNIPIPFSEGYFSKSVEGVWQGLKVFESSDIDVKKFEIDSMKNIKRTVRKNGKVLGHQKGLLKNLELLSYIDARNLIYLPCYNFVLKRYLEDEIQKLKSIAEKTGIILLDYETNADINNISKPLSHASLIKKFIESS